MAGANLYKGLGKCHVSKFHPPRIYLIGTYFSEKLAYNSIAIVIRIFGNYEETKYNPLNKISNIVY